MSCDYRLELFLSGILIVKPLESAKITQFVGATVKFTIPLKATGGIMISIPQM